MRRVFGVIVSVLMLFCGSVYGYEESSFRLDSTGGLLEDDLDLLFDPGRLPDISGFRLYTNLSNLIDKDEYIFDDSSDGAFLIGGSFSLADRERPDGCYIPEAWDFGGFIYSRDTYKYSNWLNIYDPEGNQLRGTGTVRRVYFEDDDNAGGYDRVAVEDETRTSWYENTERDWTIAAAYDLGDPGTLGVRFFRSFYDYQSKDQNYNYMFSRVETNLVTDVVTRQQSSSANGLYENKYTDNGLELSIWNQTRDNLRTSVRVSGVRSSGDYDDSWKEDMLEDNGSLLGVTDLFSSNETYSETASYSGWDWNIGGTAFYDHNPNVQTRVYVDLGFGSSEADGGAGMQQDYMDRREFELGSSTILETRDNSSGGAITDEDKSRSFRLFGYTKAEFTERVTFAAGASFSTSTFERDETSNETVRNVHTYDDGDSEVDDSDDYTQVVSSSSLHSMEYNQSNRTWTFPVGLEFELKEPVVLRLGAVHYESFTEWDRTTNITEIMPTKTRTDYGDGSFSEVLNSSSKTHVPGATENVETVSSDTDLTYGLGAQVSENLQIDIMGFGDSDLTDLSYWRLSAILKF